MNGRYARAVDHMVKVIRAEMVGADLVRCSRCGGLVRNIGMSASGLLDDVTWDAYAIAEKSHVEGCDLRTYVPPRVEGDQDGEL